MKVSVVVPAFNRANFLRETIASVLAQTYQNLELVIADDGSTDNTAEIARAFQDPRLVYLYQDNRGVSAALNLGWRSARGESIAVIGSDDVWLPECLQELVRALEQSPTIGVAYARAQGMNARGESLPQLVGAREKFPGQTLKSLVYGDFVCPIAVLIRRDALERVGGYDETLIANEDWDVWLRIARAHEIMFVPKILARYRFHAHNLTRTDSARMEQVMLDRVRVLDKFFAQPDIPADVLEIKSLAYRNVYLDWTIRHLEQRRWHKARQTFQAALSYSPARLRFLPRAIGVATFTLFLSKTAWGSRLAEKIVGARQRV